MGGTTRIEPPLLQELQQLITLNQPRPLGREKFGDLERALAGARRRAGQFVLLDVRLDTRDILPALRRLGAGLQQEAAQGNATDDR